MMLQELGAKIDLSRVHFVGMLDYHDYLNLLQVSSVHVYLTYPFVLSWSFIEAMACGCLIVGSRTPPVLEVLRDGFNGLTVDFFAPKALANRIETALGQADRMQPLRNAARTTAVKNYDLKRVLLPRWNRLFDDLINGQRPACFDDSTALIHA
jgi:glycosyltransferase involved in cell wall biosynthesis